MLESTPEKEPWLPNGLDGRVQLMQLHAIVNEVSLHITVRKLAGMLLSSPSGYVSTGNFFYALNNLEVADLFDMQSRFEDEYSEYLATGNQSFAVRNLTALALVLARAEGNTEISAEVVRVYLPMLCLLIERESKYRKGVIKQGLKAYHTYSLSMQNELEQQPDFMKQFV